MNVTESYEFTIRNKIYSDIILIGGEKICNSKPYIDMIGIGMAMGQGFLGTPLALPCSAPNEMSLKFK